MIQYFKRILNNCEEVSMHSVMGDADKISIRKRLEYYVHLAFCKCCENFNIQNKKIDFSLKSFSENIKENPPKALPNHFKTELKEKLKNL